MVLLFFHVDRKRDMRHFAIDLRNAIILDPIEGLHAVAVKVESLPKG